MERRTKIVATIGPASQSDEVIQKLLRAGVNVARLNLSHGTQDEHRVVFQRIRKIAQELQCPVCILLDLQGPKIRVGNLPGNEMDLVEGQQVTLVTSPGSNNSGKIPVDFPELPRSVKPGGRILLDDGNFELKVEEVIGEQVLTRVVTGGLLRSHKGINLPDVSIDIPALTKKDLDDIEFGLEIGVDAIAISFVRSENDILNLRQKINSLIHNDAKLPIIAKLERPEALTRLEEIIKEADGVMVARGDLGVEMSPQEVPIAQKMIIESANQHNKIVITATQMLESMIHNPRPTRAEASDVANAIFDGTDAVMLSGETAIGEYPVQAVEMMHKIICQAEANVKKWGHWHGPEAVESDVDDTTFMSKAVRELAQDRNVAAIAVFTMSGRTALHVSKTRPEVRIAAFTPDLKTYNQMEMYWGVTPYMVKHATTLEELITEVDQVLKAVGSIQPGQQVALTCGFPVATVNPTNLVLLHTIS